MKKLLTLILAFVLCFGITGCGSKDKGETSQSGGETTNGKIEKTVDAAGAELGLTDGKETLHDMIGAEEGKEFNGGSTEL